MSRKCNSHNRDFNGDPKAGTAGDLVPEGIIFVKAAQSPTDQPLLIVAKEVQGLDYDLPDHTRALNSCS